MGIDWLRQHRGSVRGLAVLVPLAVGGGLYLLRDYVANSAAALILVLFVVGIAATGDRIAGVLAGLSSAIGFDFFLTRPYLRLRIDSAEDIELTVLLLLVALAVNELALWGLRQHATASQQTGFIQGVLESADLATGSTHLPDALERVSESIRKMLGAERVTFEHGDHDAGSAVIARDGSVRRRGKDLDVASEGLPTDRSTVIPIVQRGAQIGYFQVTATRTVRPTREQLRVAVLLAGQWSLREHPIHRSEHPSRTPARPTR